MKIRLGSSKVILAAAFLLNLTGSSLAENGSRFYKDKTVRIVIGSSLGGSYGLFGQLVSRHFGKFITGSPTFIVETRPGAGGLVALNYLANNAPKDGTVITIAQANIVRESLFNQKAKFNAKDFKFIGRLTVIQHVAMASRTSGINSLDDARKRDVVTGAVGQTTVPAMLPLTLNRLAGSRFKVITGYRGTGQTFLALERGEVEVAATSLDSLHAAHWDRVKSGELRPIAVYSRTRLSEFPSTPSVMEFGKSDVDKAFLQIFILSSDIGRSLAFPPGVPNERVQAFRAAYKAMIRDPEFLADAQRVKLTISEAAGVDLDKIVADTIALPAPVLEKAKEFYLQLIKSVQMKKRQK